MVPISYSEESNKYIKEQSADLHSFDWDCDENLTLRCEIREYYRRQQKGICSYCKQVVSIVYATNCHVEHIAPKSLHPEYIFEPQNLCVICSECNQIKRNQETIGTISNTIRKKYKKKYPDKSEDFYIVHPHFDNYDDHIIIVNGLYIDKDSAKGNFTIGACRLNRRLGLVGWELEVVDEPDLINDFNNFIDEKNSLKKYSILDKIKKKLFF
ncbi:HNH endonuclease [Epilithonimonas mollis]|uniref:TIGR02646 family protein n=1 Tax=Epilithonimonas mollis TaxID=216903 RepID=A0A1M6RG54_9FLAO|nr:HNH endonuclease [Epilithonimonas mollis]SHK31442.1 TIGR02646 family protein [Epilithonimonas mollis]